MYEIFIQEGGFSFVNAGQADFVYPEMPNLLDFMQLSNEKMFYVQSQNPEADFQTFIQTQTVIAAAGGLVQNEDGDLLWIQRLGKWDLPKGHVEEGESTLVAAQREVQEECGVQDLTLVSKEPFMSYHAYWHRHLEKAVLKKTYWYKFLSTKAQKLTPQTQEEITWVGWKPLAESKTLKTYALIERLLTEGF